MKTPERGLTIVSELSSRLTNHRTPVLLEAATDYFYLQNRGYPRVSSLEWVGNRYTLNRTERDLIQRGIFSQRVAVRRRSKRRLDAQWSRETLVVDAHNVQITIESAILDRVLLKANDGALRDLARQSSQFRTTDVSREALEMIFRLLDQFRPGKVVFLFDAPMSHSGELASVYRNRLRQIGISGDARAVPVPEREIPYADCIVASSDGQVLDNAFHWVDLAVMVIESFSFLNPAVDFSAFLMTRTIDGHS